MDGDPAEARLLQGPVSRMVARLLALLALFPEQPILEQLLAICRRLLALPLHSPLGRLLTGIELLHRKGQEWEVRPSALSCLRLSVAPCPAPSGQAWEVQVRPGKACVIYTPYPVPGYTTIRAHPMGDSEGPGVVLQARCAVDRLGRGLPAVACAMHLSSGHECVW